MDLIKKISLTIKKYSMLSKGDTVLVGLSAGPDSVCLITLLNELMPAMRLRLYAVYINHGLRPKEAEKEMIFSRELCNAMGIQFFVRHADVKTYSKEHGMNKQEAGRHLRYWIFDDLAYELKADKIALGHNLNDQIETFFMRIIRGSGTLGLGAIPPQRGKIIRPLIEIERHEIEGFFNKVKIGYLTDSSNLKTDYMRNKIRASLIPDLRKLNPNIMETASRTVEILREEDRHLEITVTKTLMRLITKKTDRVTELFLVPMENMDRVILRRVLRRVMAETKGLRGIGFIHIEDIIKLIQSGSSGDRLYLPKGIRAVKKYSTLLITSEPQVKLGTYTLDDHQGEVIIKEAGMLIRADIKDRFKEGSDGHITAVFDADKVSFPLTIRARHEGDFFYPSGFGKKKKLQDFFVDEKVPRDERDSVLIVLSGNDIIWVVGMRADERFKVTGDTKRVLVLEAGQSRGL